MHTSPSLLATRSASGAAPTRTLRDPCTLSNYNKFRTKNIEVVFGIDFEGQCLSGNVLLTLESETDEGANEIVLDTSHLNIKVVVIGDKFVDWALGARSEPYGSPLNIKLDQAIGMGRTVDVKVYYSFSPLLPRPTASLRHPVDLISNDKRMHGTTMADTGPNFEQETSVHVHPVSQCQPIHARSLFPCQDTPDVKSTFSFTLYSSLPVLASGRPQLSGEESTYRFEQPVPIPSYLFAIASGDLASAPIGPRSHVWTGPPDLDAARWELEGDTEKYIAFMERLVFPYVWGTYDVLVLPPSFPYGGMENPNYTFLTPTTISGDRQNVDVVAHELCHSWSGNLVSLASWEHPWLNEGWTTYLERRIAGALHGEPARDFSAIIGWKALTDSVDQLGPDHECTKLIVDLKGKDPDEAFSSVQYEKGCTFLYYLEKLMGIEEWDKFIVHYFTKWQRKSLDSFEFKSTFLDYFHSLGNESISTRIQTINWDTWFYSPGLPPKPDFDTSMADVCYTLADKWAALCHGPNSTTKAFKPHPDDIKGWTSSQLVVFLERIQTFASPLPASASKQMGEVYKLLHTQNVELSSRYYDVALRAGDETALEPTMELLGKVGRMKFVRPLYRRLLRGYRSVAEECFQRYRVFYHPICRKMVERLLKEEA